MTEVMDAAQRLNLALDLFSAAESLLRQRVLREDPEASEEDIEARIVAWLSRRRPVRARHLRERPWHP